MLKHLFNRRNIASKRFLRPEMVNRDLGPSKGLPSHSLISHLNSSLPSEYIEALREEFMRREPGIQDFEFDSILVELKRHFIMSFLFRDIPVYSSEVQRLWADMALYTGDYHQFCQRFFGKEFPYRILGERGDKLQMDRPTYDLFYGQLFNVNENNHTLSGKFFSDPLTDETLTFLKEADEKMIVDRFFQPFEGNILEEEKLVRTLVKSVQELVSKTEEEWNSFQEEWKTSPNSRPYHHEMMFMFVMVSIYHDNENFSDALLSMSGLNLLNGSHGRNGFVTSDSGGFYGGGFDGGHDGGGSGDGGGC